MKKLPEEEKQELFRKEVWVCEKRCRGMHDDKKGPNP